MRIKWGLKIFNLNDCKTPEQLNERITKTEPIFFDTVRSCFDYLGFKIPRQRCGYCGTMYAPNQKCYIEYILTKYAD